MTITDTISESESDSGPIIYDDIEEGMYENDSEDFIDVDNELNEDRLILINKLLDAHILLFDSLLNIIK